MTVVFVDNDLHDALEQGNVAVDFHLSPVRRDLAANADDTETDLGMREALQRPLFDGVDGDDSAAARRRRHQRRQHARMVGAWVLPDDKDAVGLIEVGQLHSAFAHTQGGTHAPATGLVAHVRAIRKVVGPVGAHEKLV